MAIAMEIYEKIRYYREHTDYSQRSGQKTFDIPLYLYVNNTIADHNSGQNEPIFMTTR